MVVWGGGLGAVTSSRALVSGRGECTVLAFRRASKHCHRRGRAPPEREGVGDEMGGVGDWGWAATRSRYVCLSMLKSLDILLSMKD